MSKYCSNCGNEVDDDAVVCIKCGCAIKQEEERSACAGSALGILGIVFAWLFAIVGHILSIIGIVVGINEYKKTGKVVGLILSIIGEICAIISSVMGMLIMSGVY